MAHFPYGNVRINQFEVLDERLKPDSTIAVAEKAERLAFYLTTNSVLCPRNSRAGHTEKERQGAKCQL